MTKPGATENQGSPANELGNDRSNPEPDQTQPNNRISGPIGIGTGTVPLGERKLASDVLKALFGEGNSSENKIDENSMKNSRA
jgi:hypothetical protein